MQNTLRSVRLLEAETSRRSWLEWFSLKPALAAGGALAVIIAIFIALSGGGPSTFDNVTQQNPSVPVDSGEPMVPVSPETPVPAVAAPTEAELVMEEFEVITYVDELLAVNHPSELDDEALAEVLFSF